jgi:hypothetical protein
MGYLRARMVLGNPDWTALANWRGVLRFLCRDLCQFEKTRLSGVRERLASYQLSGNELHKMRGLVFTRRAKNA